MSKKKWRRRRRRGGKYDFAFKQFFVLLFFHRLVDSSRNRI
jgi:hypothetical protein